MRGLNIGEGGGGGGGGCTLRTFVTLPIKGCVQR